MTAQENILNTLKTRRDQAVSEGHEFRYDGTADAQGFLRYRLRDALPDGYLVSCYRYHDREYYADITEIAAADGGTATTETYRL